MFKLISCKNCDRGTAGYLSSAGLYEREINERNQRAGEYIRRKKQSRDNAIIKRNNIIAQVGIGILLLYFVILVIIKLC